ncbi:hypothetical protein [Nonomuraea roseoviolacea]|uniref:hypothetical protein n=1 Tax=Nonomuraea roseoviolacea TaxID=103837 RepID=UPI0031DFE02A
MSENAPQVRKYVVTKHSKGNNHIAKPEDDAKTLCGKPVTGDGDGAGVCGNCARLADRRGLVEATPGNIREAASITATREAWLLKAVEAFRPKFDKIGFPIPKRVHVSVGYGSKGRGTENGTILGVCFASFVSVDKVNHIYVSPEIGDTARVLDVLLHELCHAADDCRSGHKGPFAEAATALGLVGPMTATKAGEDLALELKHLAAELGEYPHGQLQPNSFPVPAPKPGVPSEELPPLPPITGGGRARPASSGPKEQKNRHALLRCVTPNCDCEGYQVRTSRKWIAVGLPSCPFGNEMQVAE